jgi:hypothetical protein
VSYDVLNIKLFWSFLTELKFYVTVAGDKTAEYGVSFLVPQGAVLSPTLFNIFTSEFPTLTDVQQALFSTHAKADVIIDRLQSALNTIKRYYS